MCVQLAMIQYMKHEQSTTEAQMVSLLKHGRQQSLAEKAFELGPQKWSSIMIDANNQRE